MNKTTTTTTNNLTKKNSNQVSNVVRSVNNSNKVSNASKSNTSGSTGSGGYSGSNIIGIVLLVIILIAVASASYWLYNYYTTKSFAKPVQVEVIPDIKDASNKSTIASGTIPNSSYSNEYSISMWLNIQDYNYKYGDEKVVLCRGDVGSGNPEIVLDAKKNDLIVRLKLQTGTQSVSQTRANSVSSFQDIPIHLPSNIVGMDSIQPEEVSYGCSKAKANAYEYNRSLNNDTHSDSNDNIFNKLGKNEVDFPTIKYVEDNNNPNCNSDSSIISSREGFEGGYFDLISGNSASDKHSSSSTSSSTTSILEGFTSVDDAVNATVKVVVDMCDIANEYQKQATADTSINTLNTQFQSVIDSLEALRATAKNSDDVSNAFNKALETTPTQAKTQMEIKLTTLEKDLLALMAFNDVVVDFNLMKNAVNAKMKSINCPLTFDGITEVDSTISFFENVLNYIKKSLFTYMTNQANSIKKLNPNSGEQQSASCIIESNSKITDPSIGTCVAKMIPLQKWVSVIVSVYNQVVDIYIDGQLTSSCILKGYPAISTSEVNITPNGGFSGKIARVMFMNTAMTVSEAKSIYYAGPVATVSLFSMIPNWVYWLILIIIIIVILYSVFA